MAENIIEYWRKESIKSLFSLKSLQNVWPIWQPEIRKRVPIVNANNIFNLGDGLYDIFYSSNKKAAGAITTVKDEQSEVSTGGTVWEALVCWYLNLCLIGRNTVVIKHSKALIPECISDAITVQYNTNTSNTESDLIALTFPEHGMLSADKDALMLHDSTGAPIPLRSRAGTYNLKAVIDSISDELFDDIEIHIIQCKTNWNDNAQIPMLWDMVYSAQKFNRSITVGRNGREINREKFTYSFVTVSTVRPSKIKSTSVCVKRVENLSGGNYWGRPSVSGVAKNVKEMLQRNLSNGHSNSVMTTLRNETGRSDFATTYDYFRL